jgi:hypothetical protein
MTEAKSGDGSMSIRSWVVLAILLVLGVVGFIGWRVGISPRNDVKPEDAARAWGEKLKLPVRGAACTMFDSDDDGYVSCVLALDGVDKVYFQGLQCGELFSRKAGGCKPDQKNPEVHLVMELSSKPPVASAAPPDLPR